MELQVTYPVKAGLVPRHTGPNIARQRSRCCLGKKEAMLFHTVATECSAALLAER